MMGYDPVPPADPYKEDTVQMVATLGAVAGTAALAAMPFFWKDSLPRFAAKCIGVGLATAGVVFTAAVVVAELVIAGEDI